MSFEAAGHGGHLFHGYHRVADLLEWEVARRDEFLGDDVTVLSGTATNINRFWVTRAEVSVRLRRERCWWTWDHCELTSVDPLRVEMHGGMNVTK